MYKEIAEKTLRSLAFAKKSLHAIYHVSLILCRLEAFHYQKYLLVLFLQLFLDEFVELWLQLVLNFCKNL